MGEWEWGTGKGASLKRRIFKMGNLEKMGKSLKREYSKWGIFKSGNL